jgi:tRNA pseudouridine13 synthase
MGREKRGFETEWATVSGSILSALFLCAHTTLRRSASHNTVKLKQTPEDFRVEEIIDLVPGETGPFSLYRLDKKNWTTPDALNAVRRRWQVPFNRLSYGGLKDRHADTTQYLTIFHGPQRNLTHQGIAVTYLGKLDHPFTSADLRANRFTLTLRSLSPAAVGHARMALAALASSGVPNYFDDQRFGSVPADGRFVAKEMVLGRFEQALKVALTAPYEHDRAAAKQEKATLAECWGDWPRCKAELPKSHARSLVDYLVHHPNDFKGALERLKPELQGLYLSAWQSHLWNKMLARWLREHVPAERLLAVKLRMGEFPMPRAVPEAALADWRALTLPLPSARLKVEPDSPVAKLIEPVMEEEGLPLDEMKLRGLRKPFFAKGDRAAAVIPEGLSAESGPDELNEEREKLVLRFDLPRGCYATMIVKRLTQARG